jgi:hypothetical protein
MKLDVKTIVTLSLTVAFIILVLFQIPIPELFNEIYRIIVIFYFGTQYQKIQDKIIELEKYKDKGG